LKKILVLLASSLIIAGCFLPTMHIGDSTLNFFDPIPVDVPGIPPNALKYTAIVIIAIALVSSILGLMNKTKWLWLSGLLTGTILVCIYLGMYIKVKEMKEEADKQISGLFGGMLRGFANSVLELITIRGYGWYVIGSGAFLLVIASIFFNKKTQLT
jgi:hypothetical protein